jgi:glycosyltransferase involved in cell wall biosynthesis
LAEDVNFLLLTDRSNFSCYAPSEKYSKYGSLHVYRLGPNFFTAIYFSTRIKFRTIEKLSLLQLFNEAVKLKQIRQVDLFHLHGLWLGKEFKQYMELSLMLSNLLKKPLIISLRGDIVSSSKGEGMPLFHPEVRKTLKYAKAITTYSSDVLKALDKLGVGSKSYLISNFINVRKFTCRTRRNFKSAMKVVFISRLDPEKEPLTVIKAFKHVIKKHPEARLTIVGSGSLYKKAQELIYALGLENKVILAGERNDVRDFLWNNDVFINMGYRTLLEAWAASLPVISDERIRVPGVRPYQNIIPFRSHDENALARSLLSIIENERLRKEIALNGRLTVENYDIKNVMPKFIRIYREILKL